MSLLVRINRMLGVGSIIARLTAEPGAESDKSAFAQHCKYLPSA